MNNLNFNTRQSMRNFVKLANACLESKVFKATGGKSENGKWLALRSKQRKVLTLASRQPVNTFKGLAFNPYGSAVIVSYKKSRTAILSH